MRPKGLSAEDEVEAERLYATGPSLKSVGERLGVDGETVRKTLLKREVKMRDQHGRRC
jgi:hypothetical protein